METSTPLRPARNSHLRRNLSWASALAAAAVAFTGLSGTASAATSQGGGHETTTQVRPATARISDGDHGLLVFINKSRASLCTPERIVFEDAFLAWLDGGAVGDPPAEPASSQEGVEPVRFTQSVFDGATAFTIDGANLPVEVWKLEDDPDGLDCTATDGPGAALFARGSMTWTLRAMTTAAQNSSDTSLQGPIVGVDGRTYNYLIRYMFRQRTGQDPSFQAVIRLEPQP